MRLRFAERAAQAGARKFVSRVRLLVSSLPIEFLIVTVGVCRLLNIESGVWAEPLVFLGPIHCSPVGFCSELCPQIMTHSAKS
jgi:hypothetical protein